MQCRGTADINIGIGGEQQNGRQSASEYGDDGGIAQIACRNGKGNMSALHDCGKHGDNKQRPIEYYGHGIGSVSVNRSGNQRCDAE